MGDNQDRLDLLVVVASPRTERIGHVLGRWVLEQLPDGVTASVVDVADVALPPDSELQPGGGQRTAASDLIARADGFVVVTPEYNHSYPASLKRLIDWHFSEWQFKAATVVTYGVQGGLLAGEHLRAVLAELSVVTTRRMVGLRAPWNHLSEAGFSPAAGEGEAVTHAVRELCWWATTLRDARTYRPWSTNGSAQALALGRWFAAQPALDPERLAGLVGSAHVVGLGFSTRQAAEPLDLVAKTTRHLIEHGAGALALLDNPRVVEQYDRFVAGHDVDLDAALAQAWGPWRTRELRDALLWLRGWNDAHPTAPVHVAGIGPARALPADYNRVLDLIGTVAPDSLDRVAESLSVIRVAHESGEHVLRARGTHPGTPFVELAHEARAAVAELTASSERDEALGLLDIIVDHHANAIGVGYDADREERDAAATVLDLQQRLGGAVVVWEGSAHLAASSSMMGGHLRDALGNRYVAVHVTFGHGRVGQHVVPAPRPGSLEHLFATRPHSRLVDLRSEPPDDVAAALDAPIRTRLISGIYDADRDEDSYFELPSLRASYDQLVFVPEVAPSSQLVHS